MPLELVRGGHGAKFGLGDLYSANRANGHSGRNTTECWQKLRKDCALKCFGVGVGGGLLSRIELDDICVNSGKESGCVKPMP